MVLQFVPSGSSAAAVVTSSSSPTSLSQFQSAISREFVTGSAIDPVLFRSATEITSDTVPLPGGDVRYPIHEALNWTRIVRFGRQARQSLYAVLLLNEDGSTWQAKLSAPRQHKDSKLNKYETPVGNGSRAYLPPVTAEIRQRIGQRYGVEVPLVGGSFWDWLTTHPEIPIVITEGGKKALALLSLGYAAIALYGVNGGYRKGEDGGRHLIEDLTLFAGNERPVMLAFDQDSKASTRHRVTVALSRFGMLLEQAACKVSLAVWRPEQGKGVDDLIVASGATAWNEAYTQAQPLLHWQISGRLLNQLNDTPSLKLTTAQLSQLDLSLLPELGIIAISSAKGTEKTKLIAEMVADSPAVVAVGHRIALMRNLSARLGLDYKGDLDRVGGEFVTSTGYTSRIGLCVDSLLAIDPNKFAGCDLVIDETVQVIRHLLTSSTCAKDGMRPVILSLLRDLIQSAGRVILADADLDSATIRCIAQLRNGDELEPGATALEPVFLIRNDYQPTGYPVLYLQAPDRTAILADLLNDAAAMTAGKALYVSTDSKAACKTLVRMLAQCCPDKRVLAINSETSGGDCEREFICNPDAVLRRGEYDIVICSPSVATGVSIEVQGVIAKVYGIFMGASATDADMAQALGRVREPVERVVWCAVRGSNYSKVSRSSNPLELRQHLFERTTVTTSLIRSSLKADLVTAIERYDWQADPYVMLYCRIAAAQNYSMYRLRDALMIRLSVEGNRVMVESRESNGAVREQAAAARLEQSAADAAAIVSSPGLSSAEVAALEATEGLTPEQARSLKRFYLQEFYALNDLSESDVLWDNEGRRRGEILNLEHLLYPQVAVERTAKALEKQMAWNQGLCPWDISNAVLRQTLRHMVGIDELFAKARDGWEWTAFDLRPYAERARAVASQIKVVLHLTIHGKMSDVQVVHQLLAQLGLKLSFRWSRSVVGHEGEKLRVWQLEQAHWKQLAQVIHRRSQKRSSSSLAQEQEPSSVQASEQAAQTVGSPVSFNEFISRGDPSAVPVLELDLPLSPPRSPAVELSSCISQEPERARALLQSWGVEQRVEAMAQLAPPLLDRLVETVPDLFRWCAS